MKREILLLGIIALFLHLCSANSVDASTLVYDDFNDGTIGTNQGGVAGSMSDGGYYDPVVKFVSDSAYEGSYALSLEYDFPSGSWSGYYSYFKADKSGYDVSDYYALEMWVKGAAGGEKFKIEVADECFDPENLQTYSHKKAINITSISEFSEGLTTDWKKLSIPLESFTGGASEVDLTKLKQLNIVFDQIPRSGTIFIDLIKFASETTSVSIIPSTQNVINEEMFTVEIEVDPATEIAGVQLDLHFDPSIVNVMENGVEEGDLLVRGGPTEFWWQELGAGAIRIYCSITGTGNVSTTGTFATIQMLSDNVDGTSTLQLTNVRVGDLQGTTVNVKTEDAEVTVTTYQDWDVNCDNGIDILDFVPISQHWGETGTSHWTRADVNRDGLIDISDMVLVAQRWVG